MAKCKVTLTRCIQDSQDYGSDDEHMISRVFFKMDIDGRHYSDLHADIKQVVGSNYETGDIEVSHPRGYTGPFNYTAFRDAVEVYYRRLVGSAASVMRPGPGSRMRNNTFNIEKVVEFDVDTTGSGGW
jgi:hypothetical protein